MTAISQGYKTLLLIIKWYVGVMRDRFASYRIFIEEVLYRRVVF